MKLFDLVKLACSNLWRRRLRTVLTVIGVIIGTACIIVMITLGISNIEQTEEGYGSQDLDIITVSAEQSMMGNSSSASKTLNDNVVQQFQNINGVKAVSPVLQFSLFIEVGKYKTDLWVTAIDASFLKEKKLYSGAMIREGGLPELLLTQDYLRSFHDPNNPSEDFYNDMDYASNGNDIDDPKLPGPDLDWLSIPVKVTFGNNPAIYEDMEASEDEPVIGKTYIGNISGIFDAKAYEYNNYVGLETAKNMIRENRKLAEQYGIKDNQYTEIRIKATERKDVNQIMTMIKELGYEPRSNLEAIEEWQSNLRRQQSQLLLIALITLLVSAIGIANTMLTSILERRKEIGVMKVMGMKIQSINLLFLTEAGIIGSVGGLIGTSMSYLIVYILNGNIVGQESQLFGLYFGEDASLNIPLWLIVVAVGIAMLTGLLSGIYPSVKATKMSPLEAMHS